jgi:hypothetical protein
VVTTPLRLAFVKSAGFFDAGFLFESMGCPFPALSRSCLPQNVRLPGGSNQGWMKSNDRIPIPVTFVARRLSRMPALCLKWW